MMPSVIGDRVIRSRDRKLISAVWAEHRSLAEGMVDSTDLDSRFPPESVAKHCLKDVDPQLLAPYPPLPAPP